MSRDARPLVGVIATSGIDAEQWLRQTALPETHSWKLIDPLNVPRQAVMLVWLWKAEATPEQRRFDLRLLLRCLDRLANRRGNRLVPSLFVAQESLDGETWRADVQRQLQWFYARRMKQVVPKALTEIDRITVNDGGERTGERLVEQGQALSATITRWRSQLKRQAGQCLKAGLAFSVGYVLLLLLSFPWNASEHERPRPRPLLDWTWAEWRQHLDACRLLLDQIGDRHWLQLDRETQAAYSQYLRWLPVSLDLLHQRESSRQSERYQAEIQSLLGRMEGQVARWVSYDVRKAGPPAWRAGLALGPTLAEFLYREGKQRVTEELLDNVFDPRPGASELRRLAEQFWVDDRAHTQALLRVALAKAASPADQQVIVVRVLQDRLKAREATRVYAPNRKLAALQELEQAIDWAVQLQQSKRPVAAADFRQASTPGLIREAAGESK